MNNFILRELLTSYNRIRTQKLCNVLGTQITKDN